MHFREKFNFFFSFFLSGEKAEVTSIHSRLSLLE